MERKPKEMKDERLVYNGFMIQIENDYVRYKVTNGNIVRFDLTPMAVSYDSKTLLLDSPVKIVGMSLFEYVLMEVKNKMNIPYVDITFKPNGLTRQDPLKGWSLRICDGSPIMYVPSAKVSLDETNNQISNKLNKQEKRRADLVWGSRPLLG